VNSILRALLGSFCVSDAGIASCPAAPFAGRHQETDLDWEICAFSDYERKKADLAASLWNCGCRRYRPFTNEQWVEAVFHVPESLSQVSLQITVRARCLPWSSAS